MQVLNSKSDAPGMRMFASLHQRVCLRGLLSVTYPKNRLTDLSSTRLAVHLQKVSGTNSDNR